MRMEAVNTQTRQIPQRDIHSKIRQGRPQSWKRSLANELVVFFQNHATNDSLDTQGSLNRALGQLRQSMPGVAKVLEEIYLENKTTQQIAKEQGVAEHIIRHKKNIGLEKIQDNLWSGTEIENKKLQYTQEQLAFIEHLCHTKEYRHVGARGQDLGVDAEKITNAFNEKFQQNRDPRAIRKLISTRGLSNSLKN